MKFPSFLLIAFVLAACPPLRSEETAAVSPPAPVVVKAGDTFPASDSLNCGAEANADASECLLGLRWTCAPFNVQCQAAADGQGDMLVRFPSARPTGDATNDLVAMEWRMAKDKDGKVLRAPAVVVVHESGRGMVAGRLFANGLRAYGIHTLLIHLPGYGARTPAVRADIKGMLPALTQAVADARRARDAVAALPNIDTSNISVLGISLGGFVTSTVAGLDHGYNKVFILLAGGNLPDVILNGTKDAAKLRKELEKAGVTVQEIKDLSRHIEPMRLACRVDPACTWLFSGTKDEVVPPACSVAFAKAANLAGHHVELPVGHYTAVIMIPVILQQTADIILGIVRPAVPAAATGEKP